MQSLKPRHVATFINVAWKMRVEVRFDGNAYTITVNGSGTHHEAKLRDAINKAMDIAGV